MNARRIAFALLRVYWRIFKPRTFGVKAVVLHPEQKNTVLLVQHTYGDREAWSFPGGGYNPRKESARDAVARELAEELSLSCSDYVELGDHYTEKQGKKDTVAIFSCVAGSLDIRMNPEIRDTKWVPVADLAGNESYYRVVRRGAELLLAARDRAE